ncbi:HEAT repeat domain-containing protein [Trichocoleus sp. FACHB-90]|uniref:HEAT repeat domain-containing protein n=1 Tax=Cyanophyceae TaxID=3028117 RepID=UPI0016848671|nr:HEAT repeat domain-containing protein [Trichocoleus sp. FACHB-90]MBD1928191.1 HEAT repeat domain-containing protein [Trichocoleus sp. FACHB-90]
MKLWDGWDNFLKVMASDHQLTVDQQAVFLVRFARQNIHKKNQDVADEVIGGEPEKALQSYDKYMKEIFGKLSQSFPEVNSEYKGKVKRVQACLEKVYLEQQQNKDSETGSAIASHDWRQICRDMLESQKLNIRRQATEVVSKAFYVELGLVERKHQPRRSDDSSVSPEQGSGFFQLHEEEITQTYEHEEFLEQVITQGQSKKSQGRRIAIIGEPGAGKTTLLEAIAFSPKTPGFPIWVSLGSLRDKSLEEYLRQKWLKDALKTSDVSEQQKELENLFKSGEVLLLLDGVDEMPASSPVEALAKLREEVTGWVADARTVLTCRQNVWDASVNALPGFDTYRTLDFSYGESNKPDQVRQFICEWFSIAEKPELGEPLREKLDEDRHQRIRDLVKNPLRLSLLCQSWYFRQGDLPETKATLYEQFTEAFYEWKEELHSTTLTEREKLNEALGLLAREAIDKEKSRFAIRESFALKVMGEDLFKLATEKLNWLVEVYKDTDTGKPVYAFFHPTFQEYFAACTIPHWDYFLNHVPHNPAQGTYLIFEPQWKEVFLLWLGRKEIPKEQKEKLIKVLVKFEDGCKNFYRYRAYFLAAAGIAEFRECRWADDIVAQIVGWGFGYFNADIQEFGTFLVPIEEGCKAALRESAPRKAINALIHLLTNSQHAVTQQRIAQSLGEIGTANLDAIGALTHLVVNTQNDRTRYQATKSLEKVGIGNQKVIDTLTQLLHPNLDEDTRWRSAYTLGVVHPGNQKAIGTLTTLLHNPRNPRNLLSIASSLEKIHPGNEDAIKALIHLLHSGQPSLIRRMAAKFLWIICTYKPDVVKVLTDQLHSKQDKNTPWIVAEGLCEIGTDNRDTINALISLLHPNQDEDTRLRAAYILGAIHHSKPDTINALIELLTSLNEGIRGRAAYTLGAINPGNRDIAINVLTELLTSPNESIRLRVAESLGTIAPDNPKAITALIELLYNSHDDWIRRGAIESIGKIGAGNSKAITALIDVLHNSHDDLTCREAIESIGKIAPGNSEAIAVLIKLLQISQDLLIRIKAAKSLQEILQDDLFSDVVSGLKNCLTDRSYENDSALYTLCYEVIWHCTQNMTYPDFYQAWNS